LKQLIASDDYEMELPLMNFDPLACIGRSAGAFRRYRKEFWHLCTR
jgi:hypothetical protein